MDQKLGCRAKGSNIASFLVLQNWKMDMDGGFLHLSFTICLSFTQCKTPRAITFLKFNTFVHTNIYSENINNTSCP